jgi:4-oxalocrotonate tautomerase
MPHVTVTLWPGKTTEQKQQLSDAIVDSVTNILGYAVSVGFEEVGAEDWMEKVYGPLVADRWSSLTHKPGYGPGPTEEIERTGS